MPTIVMVSRGAYSIIFDMGAMERNEMFDFFYDGGFKPTMITICPRTQAPGLIDKTLPGFEIMEDRVRFRAGTKGSPPVRVDICATHSITQ